MKRGKRSLAVLVAMFNEARLTEICMRLCSIRTRVCTEQSKNIMRRFSIPVEDSETKFIRCVHPQTSVSLLRVLWAIWWIGVQSSRFLSSFSFHVNFPSYLTFIYLTTLRLIDTVAPSLRFSSRKSFPTSFPPPSDFRVFPKRETRRKANEQQQKWPSNDIHPFLFSHDLCSSCSLSASPSYFIYTNHPSALNGGCPHHPLTYTSTHMSYAVDFDANPFLFHFCEVKIGCAIDGWTRNRSRGKFSFEIRTLSHHSITLN